MKTAPATRSAWSAASSSAPPAIAQWATNTQRAVPVASRTASASSASAVRAVVGGAVGPVGAAVAARVEGDHPEVPGEVGDLAFQKREWMIDQGGSRRRVCSPWPNTS